jgi:hypothetical protein
MELNFAESENLGILAPAHNNGVYGGKFINFQTFSFPPLISSINDMSVSCEPSALQEAEGTNFRNT